MKNPFRLRHSLVKIFSALAVVVLLCSDFRSATAQPAPAGQPPIVRQIEIQYAGPATISRERILANMRTAVGKPYSEQAVEEDIRSLYATGNLTNVRIFGEPRRDGVKVVVVIQSKATVGEVFVEGATRINPNKLR